MQNALKLSVLCAALLSGFVTAIDDSNLKTYIVIANAAIVQEIFTQARLHTKPELAACKTLECVEDLIYKQSDKKLDELLSDLQIPESEQKQFCAQWDTKKKLCQRMLAEDVSTRHKQSIDEDGLGTPLVEATKNMLAKNNINPKRIDLKRVNIPIAHRILPTFLSKMLHIDPPRGEATSMLGITGRISFNRAHKKVEASDLDIIAHEVTHIKECHVDYMNDINKLAADFYINRYKSKKQKSTEILMKPLETRTELFKSFETQAELFPIVRLEDQRITQGLIKRHMSDCIAEHSAGTLSKKWHTSPSFATHPHCTELLPYILKVDDLKKQGAVPLYEKRT